MARRTVEPKCFSKAELDIVKRLARDLPFYFGVEPRLRRALRRIVKIVNDKTATKDERDHALFTVAEIIFPKPPQEW